SAAGDEENWQTNFIQRINDPKDLSTKAEDDMQIKAIVQDVREFLSARDSTDPNEFLQTSKRIDLLAHDVSCLTEKDLERLLPKINEQLHQSRSNLIFESGMLQVGKMDGRIPYSIIGAIRKEKDSGCLSY